MLLKVPPTEKQRLLDNNFCVFMEHTIYIYIYTSHKNLRSFKNEKSHLTHRGTHFHPVSSSVDGWTTSAWGSPRSKKLQSRQFQSSKTALLEARAQRPVRFNPSLLLSHHQRVNHYQAPFVKAE